MDEKTSKDLAHISERVKQFIFPFLVSSIPEELPKLLEDFRNTLAQIPTAKHLAEKVPILPKRKDLIEQCLNNLNLAVFEDVEYGRLRGLVMDVHAYIEMLLTFSIANHYISIDQKEKIDEFIDKVLFEIPYAKKAAILLELKIISKELFSSAMKINNLRVAFAHGYPKEHKRFRYGKGSIFDAGSKVLIWNDFEKVLKPFIPLIQKQLLKQTKI